MDPQDKISDKKEMSTNECDESTITDATPTTPKRKWVGEFNSPRNRSYAYHDMHSPPRTSRNLKIPLELVMNNEDTQSVKSNTTYKTSTTCSSASSPSSYVYVSESKHDSLKTSNKKRDLISVDELLSEDPPLRNTIIFLVLLRVVATNQNSDTTYYSVKSFKKKSYSDSKCAYTRLFLCMDVNSPTGQTVYIGEGRGIGMNLWSRIASVRDNGVAGVGSILALNSPKPITKMLANEIPILETNSSLQLMVRKPFETIKVDAGVPENLTRGFILNECNLEVVSAEVLSTACSGLFCDRQRTLELLRTGKKCGCYFMRSIASNLSIVHTIKIREENQSVFLKIEEFSSFKFSLLYLSEYFPKSTQRISFDSGSENMEALYECMDKVINFYNENGGFTIIGWYKRGEINDSIQSNDNEKVTSSIMNYHVTSIYPTKYIHHNAKETQVMKFDILDIE